MLTFFCLILDTKGKLANFFVISMEIRKNKEAQLIPKQRTFK